MKNLTATLAIIGIMMIPGIVDLIVDATPAWLTAILSIAMLSLIPIVIAGSLRMMARAWMDRDRA